MADRIRFHLDEHIDRAVARALRRCGVDVTTTVEVGLRTKDDRAQLAYAQSTGRVLVTRDKGFLRLAATEPHSGIVFCGATTSIGELVRGLHLIHEVLEPEEIAGRVEYI